jgi:hypothetical protein
MNQSQRGGDSRKQQGSREQSQRGPDSERGQQSHGGKQPQGGQQSQGQQSQGQQSQGQQSQGQQSQQNVYGEGNYQATRDYNARTKAFIESGRVGEAARDAAPRSDDEARQMADAEAEGKRHAKEEDPEISMPESNVGPEDSGTPRPGQEK